MKTLLLSALAAITLLAAPANAQWRYEESGGEARAYVVGQNGTSLGLRCTALDGDRQNIFLDLMVFSTTQAPDNEDVAEFRVGTWTYNFETVRVGPVGAMYRYQSRFNFYDDVNQSMRNALKSGSTLRFTRTFDFAPMTFGLRGSRNAIERLERACPRLWASSAGTTAPRQTPVQPPARAAPAPVLPSTMPPDALAALEGYVASLIGPQCAPGSSPDLSNGVFLPSGDRVTVRPGRASCAWAFQVNPYCGARLCQTWVYEWDGNAFNLVEDSLR